MPANTNQYKLRITLFPSVEQLAISPLNNASHELLPLYWLSRWVAPVISLLSITTGSYFVFRLLEALFPMYLSLSIALLLILLLEMIKHLLSPVAVRSIARRYFLRALLLWALLLPCFAGSAYVTLQGIETYLQARRAPVETVTPIALSGLDYYDEQLAANEEALEALRTEASNTGTFHWKSIQDQLSQRLAISSQLQAERAAAAQRQLEVSVQRQQEQETIYQLELNRLWVVGAVLESLLLLALCFQASFRWQATQQQGATADAADTHSAKAEPNSIPVRSVANTLTEKQRAIAALLDSGDSYRSIQAKLHVSPKTIAKVRQELSLSS